MIPDFESALSDLIDEYDMTPLDDMIDVLQRTLNDLEAERDAPEEPDAD